MNSFVLDASVVVGFLLGKSEVLNKKLPQLLRSARDGKIKILSTSLLPFEVANALRYSLSNKNESDLIISKFFKLPVEYSKLTSAQIKKSLDISYEIGTTVYDTSYHVLAKANGATFVTCDKDYYKKAKSFGDIEFLG